MELLSEEEQWEALKAWIRKNGGFFVGVVLLGLAAVFGMRWWQGHNRNQSLEASAAYEKILETFDAGKTDQGLAQIEALRQEYPKSVYVTSADLAATRLFVARNELDKAELRLKRLQGYTTDEALKPLLTLRLARVQTGLGRYDEALATLGSGDHGVHTAAFAEARGDALAAKGDKAGALLEYEKARKALPVVEAGTGVDVVLDLKINDLKSGVAAK